MAAVAAPSDVGGTFVKQYIAHATVSNFHVSPKLVRGIRGPVGSGKSVACCMEIINRGLLQVHRLSGV